MTFHDEFDGPLDVSAWSPGTKWIAHTPCNGGFDSSKFADPTDGFPFTIRDGVLFIEARKTTDQWESGLLSSADPDGNGFAQQYGYFEMRAKMPQGPGTWPAFWLLGTHRLKEKVRDDFEVDIVEQYGHAPNRLHNVLHWWFPDQTHKGAGHVSWVDDMTADFHTYGCIIDEQFIVMYFDGKEVWRYETPDMAKRELYVLVNLALGPGWPTDHTPNPSFMEVDYIRVYAKKFTADVRSME